MQRAKSICRVIGCNHLIDAPGYCPAHADRQNDRFKDLAKAPGSKKFYSGKKWTDNSLAYRKANPLCIQCKRRGKIKKVELVDHIIERLDYDGDPYDWANLQSLCRSCHNSKLRTRKNN